MAVGRSRQGTNQEGGLGGNRSAWGQALGAAIGRTIDQPLPIGTTPHNFGGTAGGVMTLSASVLPLIGTNGYFGDMPQAQQGVVVAAPPWERA